MIGTRWWLLAGLAVLTVGAMTACSANNTPGSASAGNSRTTPPAATTTPAAAAPASRANTSPDATTGAGGIQNLVISSAMKNNLTAAYVAYRGIALADVAGAGPMPGSVYYAYDSATATYWALATFQPSGTATVGAGADFYSPAGDEGLFRMSGASPWQVEDLPVADATIVCAEAHWFPETVLTAWSLPTSGQC